jgi:hypothetical protein
LNITHFAIWYVSDQGKYREAEMEDWHVSRGKKIPSRFGILFAKLFHTNFLMQVYAIFL